MGFISNEKGDLPSSKLAANFSRVTLPVVGVGRLDSKIVDFQGLYVNLPDGISNKLVFLATTDGRYSTDDPAGGVCPG